MDLKEKIRIGTELLKNVGTDFMNAITLSPKKFDGIELRQLLLDIVKDKYAYKKMSRKRYTEYRNWYITNL